MLVRHSIPCRHCRHRERERERDRESERERARVLEISKIHYSPDPLPIKASPVEWAFRVGPRRNYPAPVWPG